VAHSTGFLSLLDLVRFLRLSTSPLKSRGEKKKSKKRPKTKLR